VRHLVNGLLAALLVAIGAAAPARAAGGTLLVYDSLAKPFSLEDEVEPVAILLSRFETNLVRREAGALKPDDIRDASHIVVVGTAGVPAFDPECRRLLESTKTPLMAVGGAVALAKGGIPSTRVRPAAVADGTVRHLGSRWPARVDPLFPVEVDASQVLAAVVDGKRESVLCFREGNRFGFAALPSAPPLSMVFSDALVEFYGAPEPPPASMLFVVEDFHPGCSPASMRRLVDYFSHLGIPFAVSTQMQRLPEGVEAMPEEEFLETLRYAQTRGGRVFPKGAEGLASASKFQEAGLAPAGVADPAPIDPAAIQIGRLFYRKSPGDDPEPFPLHHPLRLAKGGWLWPANVRGGLDGGHLDAVRSQVRRIVSFRGGVAGVVVPAWLPFQSMRDLVDAARGVEVPVSDPLTSVPPLSRP
jgi:hypothetical protein